MKDHSAGGITNAEAQRCSGICRGRSTCRASSFTPGVSYRNLLVYRGDAEVRRHDQAAARDSRRSRRRNTCRRGRARGPAADHRPVARAVRGPRDQPGPQRDRAEPGDAGVAVGPGPRAEHAEVRRPVRREAGCMITGVDLLRGLAVLLGWDVHEVEGMTSFHDTNYAGQGRRPPRCWTSTTWSSATSSRRTRRSHQADWKTKVAAIEHIDQLRRRAGAGEAADVSRMADPGHAGSPDQHRDAEAWLRPDAASRWRGRACTACGQRPYSERNAAASGLKIERGHELMEYFLRGEVRYECALDADADRVHADI